jgi:hypothetical protein
MKSVQWYRPRPSVVSSQDAPPETPPAPQNPQQKRPVPRKSGALPAEDGVNSSEAKCIWATAAKAVKMHSADQRCLEPMQDAGAVISCRRLQLNRMEEIKRHRAAQRKNVRRVRWPQERIYRRGPLRILGTCAVANGDAGALIRCVWQCDSLESMARTLFDEVVRGNPSGVMDKAAAQILCALLLA